MTKCIVLGAKEEKKKETGIAFKYFLDYNEGKFKITIPYAIPKDFEYIELVCLNYFDDYDLH